MESSRNVAGKFVETLTNLPRYCWNIARQASAAGATGRITGRGTASTDSLIEMLRHACSMPEPGRVTVLGRVASALPPYCTAPQGALAVLEELRSAIDTLDAPLLRYCASVQLGEILIDPQFGRLSATAGAEGFFHRFRNDLDAASHVIPYFPDSHVQVGKVRQIRERVLLLATWAGLMAPVNVAAASERVALLEQFSCSLPHLQSADERARGFACLLEKVPDLPFSSRIAVVHNLTKSIHECVASEERLQKFQQVAALTARFPVVVRSRLLGQMCAQVALVPTVQRRIAFEILLQHVAELEHAGNPDCPYRLALALTDLPPGPARQAAWIDLAKLTNSLPQNARALPIAGLVQSIEVLADAPPRSDCMAWLGSNVIDLPPPIRHKTLMYMLGTVRRLPEGPARAAVLEQATLLMNMADTSAQDGVMQLQALTGSLHHVESVDECVAVLQTVIEKARGLPDSARTEVLESMIPEFRGWPNRSLLKPAVVMISRECQQASPEIKERLALAVNTSLLAVGSDLQAELGKPGVTAESVASTEAWFQAMAIAPAAGRAGVLQAADDLVLSAVQNNRLLGKSLFDAYRRQFPQSMQRNLLARLAAAPAPAPV